MVDHWCAKFFEEGGWFEEAVSGAPELREMLEDDGVSMADMQASFGSFLRASLGGGGEAFLPDGTSVSAPRLRLPLAYATYRREQKA